MILSTLGISESVATPVAGSFFWYDPGNSASYPGSGTTLYDLSGSENNATISGSPIYTDEQGGYFTFDGSNDYILSPNVFNSGSSLHTVEVWIKPSANDDCLWSDIGQASINTGYHFAGSQIYASGLNNRITAGVWNGTTITYSYHDGSYLNNWVQVVRTYDGTHVRLYINGELKSTTSVTYDDPPTSWYLGFGAVDTTEIPGTTAGYFAGRYGTIRYYKFTLSDGDVMKNYQSTLPLYIYDDPVVESFTSTGTTSWTAPAGVQNVEYLVVGGGGGGGNGYDSGGGGGGAGGMVLTGVLSVVAGNSYTVTVGSGGIGGADTRANNNGTTGNDSVFGTITALGGIYGGGSRTNNPGPAGVGAGIGGAAQISNTTAARGGNGGAGGGAGGGGGGASGAGTNRISSSSAGVGGAGLSSSISGVTITYGAGGNGGTANVNNNNGAAGGANTGKGGGAGSATGSNSGGGGNGGSGVVIIKYRPPL